MAQNKIKLIVGLGNPGNEYRETRHNAGQWFVERLAQQYRQTFQSESRFFGSVCRLPPPYNETRLLIPNTFMNLSGKAVLALAQFYRIDPTEILVVHDEMALLPGSIRLKFDGSTAGHNGLKDIVSKFGNQSNFHRLRIGIGHPGQRDKVVGFVLNKPSLIERDLIDVAINHGLNQIEHLLKFEMALAMNHLNGFQATQ